MSSFRHSSGSSFKSSIYVRQKIKVYVILVVISFLGLWMRVWYLQILKGKDFMGQSEENRVTKVSLPDYRGAIKDRRGETVVNIRPSFNLYVTPEDADNLPKSLELLSRTMEIKEENLKENIRRSRSFQDVLVKKDISRKDTAYIEENKMRLPGISIKVEPLRSYVYKDFAAHVLGYLGEISKSKLKTSEYSKYKLGEMVGAKSPLVMLEEFGKANINGSVNVLQQGDDSEFTIDLFTVEINNLSRPINNYIEMWERETGNTLPRKGSAIVLEISGDLNRPIIKGLDF